MLKIAAFFLVMSVNFLHAMDSESVRLHNDNLAFFIQESIQKQSPGRLFLEVYNNKGLARFTVWNHNGQKVSDQISKIINIQRYNLERSHALNMVPKNSFLRYVLRNSWDNQPFLVLFATNSGVFIEKQ